MSDEKTYQSYIDFESSDEIVISGIAGRFPSSDNVKQLQENLFNKIDLVREDHGRWNAENLEFSSRMGVINNLEKFDTDFFDVSFKYANVFDPSVRILLEHTYEAIIDAGINPKQLSGKNTAVIIGTSYLETQKALLYNNIQKNDISIIGCSKSALANMLSYSLNVKGPSQIVDTACSSSLYAIAVAYNYIMKGQCEDAIVGAANLCLHPKVHMQFHRLGVLASNGYCRPLDIAANGYTRAETVSVVYLQKAKNAKRIYAICKHIKLNNDGYKEEGVTFPSTYMQSALLTEFYNECKIPSSYLDYIEVHGTGTKAGDPPEINAIHNVLCKNRKTLMVESVKSNLGHAEASSGFTQIAKVKQFI